MTTSVHAERDPDMVGRVKRYREETTFSDSRSSTIETAYSRTVTLPSGGAIVIDHTEAGRSSRST